MDKLNIEQPKTLRENDDVHLGKKSPQNVEMEKAVLSAILVDGSSLSKITSILSVDAFYLPTHQHIYEAILNIDSKGIPLDSELLVEELIRIGKLEEAGGPVYILEISNTVGSSAHIEYHARIVAQKKIQRDLITLGNDVIKRSYDNTKDVFDTIEHIDAIIQSVEQRKTTLPEEGIEILRRAIASIIDIRENKHVNKLVGIDTGFKQLNENTGGWEKGDLIIIGGRPGMGKCLKKGTKLLMHSGELKNVEDIKVGELLMGDDSAPRKVLSLARGREKMYWVRQNKGIDYCVNESHILSLRRSRNEGKHKHGDILNISVKDYIKKSNKFKSNYKGYKVAVEFDQKPLTVDPYFLGIWLADGSSSCVGVTTNDHEVVSYLEIYANKLNLQVTKSKETKKCPTYSITKGYMGGNNKKLFSLQGELRKLDVINNKHIPNIYLINSRMNRLKILAGLLDTDGYYSREYNIFEITQKNKKLANQIKFLADSLGYRASIKSKIAKIKSIEFKCKVYRVRISGKLDEIPTKVERNKARKLLTNRDILHTGIKVEYDKVDDYYGFEIDGNRLFLLEDMTVTHNTSFATKCISNSKKRGMFFSLEMPSERLMKRMISQETSIKGHDIKFGNVSDKQILQMNDISFAENIIIDDTSSLSVNEIARRATKAVKEDNIEFIIIDYLQIINIVTSRNGNRDQALGQVTGRLKALAKDLNIPVVALAQVNRAAALRGDKRPGISDLRESGSIEQDADIIIFIHREEYYDKNAVDHEGNSLVGKAEIIIAKNRNGDTDSFLVDFIAEITSFKDISSNDDNNYDHTLNRNYGLEVNEDGFK